MLNFLLPKPKFQTIGWIGMVLILIAYFLASFNILSVDNIWFQIMNIVGSVGIILVAYFRKDWQPIVLNIVWILIAIGAIIKLII